MHTIPAPTLKNWIFLIVLGIIWGSSFMGVKLALTGFPPLTIAAIRLLIAATILLVFCFISGKCLPNFRTKTNRRIWLHMFLMGLLTNAFPFSLLNWGQLYVSSGFAGLTMAIIPLLILPISHFTIPNEIMTVRKTIGFIIGFIGIIILIGVNQIFVNVNTAYENLARIACITAACCYALGSINTRLCPPVSIITFSTGGLSIGALIMLMVALITEGIPTNPTSTAIIGVIFLGVFPTAIATLMLVTLINTAGPSFMSLVNYQVPLWAIFFGVIFLHEKLPASIIVALILILTGLAVSQTQHMKIKSNN